MKLALMARLARHRTQARISQATIAAALGVDRVTVYRWETGERSPHVTHAVAYARLVGQQVVLCDGERVLAIDSGIPAALPHLRKGAGLSPRQLARRLRVITPAVHAAERRGYQLLCSHEAVAAGLGLTVGLRHTDPQTVLTQAVGCG